MQSHICNTNFSLEEKSRKKWKFSMKNMKFFTLFLWQNIAAAANEGDVARMVANVVKTAEFLEANPAKYVKLAMGVDQVLVTARDHF